MDPSIATITILDFRTTNTASSFKPNDNFMPAHIDVWCSYVRMHCVSKCMHTGIHTYIHGSLNSWPCNGSLLYIDTLMCVCAYAFILANVYIYGVPAHAYVYVCPGLIGHAELGSAKLSGQFSDNWLSFIFIGSVFNLLHIYIYTRNRSITGNVTASDLMPELQQWN